MRRISSALFLLGLGLLIAMIFQTMEFGSVAPLVGQAINATAAEQVGAANFVTSVVLGYRGFDTLLELTILFTAATAGGLVLGKPRAGAVRDPDSGFILRAGADLLAQDRVLGPGLADELVELVLIYLPESSNKVRLIGRIGSAAPCVADRAGEHPPQDPQRSGRRRRR